MAIRIAIWRIADEKLRGVAMIMVVIALALGASTGFGKFEQMVITGLSQNLIPSILHGGRAQPVPAAGESHGGK